MARGNSILVTPDPKGKFEGGVIADTSKPGTIVQRVPATGLTSGACQFRAANSGTDGKAVSLGVLLEDALQGKTVNDAYVSGTMCQVYFPQPGEELNLRVGEVAGTGNSYAVGDRLIVDAEDGILVPESGSPQTTVAEAMEAVTQVSGSSLLWCRVF